ncbi:MAG TPA: hypothetical protein VFP81_03865 [Propionibacteriaceae bacterium]|nr:hypothetical protein [Propionibacteriaceae bacterium]
MTNSLDVTDGPSHTYPMRRPQNVTPPSRQPRLLIKATGQLFGPPGALLGKIARTQPYSMAGHLRKSTW